MTNAQRNLLHRLAGGVIDALDHHVAILDVAGKIVAVNEAWMRFAHENGAPGFPADADAFVGANYLAACEAAAREGDESARAMLRSCRALLAGRGGPAAIEYACHAPGKRRWFQAQVTPFTHGGARFLAVVHEDISARMLAQQERLLVQEKLREALERERVRSRTDDLTGLCTRGHFFELAEKLASASRRYATPLAIVMLDLDEFKAINDRHGHQQGDAILQCVARIAREQLRAADVVARYGGDELIAALPHTDLAHGAATAEKLRDNVRTCVLGGALGVTISAGVAEMNRRGETLDEAIRRADEALYRAKHDGRNRVHAAS